MSSFSLFSRCSTSRFDFRSTRPLTLFFFLPSHFHFPFSSEQRSTILGTNSLGFIWPEEGHDSDNDSDSDSEEDLLESAPNKRLLQLGRSTSSLCLSDSSGTISVLSQESTPPSSPTQSATSSQAALPTSHLSPLSPSQGAGLTLALEVGDQPGFRSECIATLDHAFEKGGEVDTESIDFAALQIKSARATTNVGPGIVRDVVLGYLVSKVEGVEQGAGKGVVKVKAEELFEQWGPLLSKFAEVEEEKVETLQFLQVSYRTPLSPANSSSTRRPLFLDLLEFDSRRVADLFSPFSLLRFASRNTASQPNPSNPTTEPSSQHSTTPTLSKRRISSPGTSISDRGKERRWKLSYSRRGRS